MTRESWCKAVVLAATVTVAIGHWNSAGAAEKSGGTVVMAGLPTQNVMDVFIADMKEKFGINVRFVKVLSNSAYTQAVVEVSANRVVTDVILTTMPLLKRLNEKAMLEPLPKESLGLFEDKWRDPEGRWVAFEGLPLGIIYNNKLVSAAEAPKTFEDLLQPKWKGQIAMGNPSKSLNYADGFRSWYGVWGKEKGDAFMRGLAEQKPRFFGNPSVVSVAVDQGQAKIGITNVVHSFSIGGEGGDLSSVKFDHYFAEIAAIGILKGSPNPREAQLAVKYFLSPEFMTKVAKDFGYPVNAKGIESSIVALQGVTIDPYYEFHDTNELKAFLKTLPEMFQR